MRWVMKDGVTVRRRIGGVAIALEGPARGGCEADAVRYVLRDHLGSVDVLADASGAAAQSMGFTAWGARRDPDGWTELADAAARSFDACATARGFTGHEMLDAVGAVHMNGRLYDPALGRFLRADPFVQFPADLQGHNRYSYALNNPLAHTDPNGYFLKGLLRPLAGIAISVWLPGAGFWTGTGLFAANGVGAIAASGFIAGAVGSGSLKGAVVGAFSAAALNGIGGIPFGGGVAGVAVRSATYGFVGGVTAALQGGRFGHGFLSGAATQVAAGRIGALERERQRVIASAVLGGTVSAATGGKFANGAATAAFGRVASERQQRWLASQRAAFGGRVALNTDLAAPGTAVAPLQSGSAEADLRRDLNPPRPAADPAAVPIASEAVLEFSATHGTDASFDRPTDRQRFLWGGFSAEALREQHIVYAGTALAAVPAVLGASSGTTFVVGFNTLKQKTVVLLLLELNASAISFANQYLITNAARQIPSAYVQYISRVPGPKLPYSLVQPK